ncbi:MAG: TolC family protein [Chitinophagaceae bacterium]|nr:TolC family protein [Chitinophagaceae bacterium]
MRKAFIASLTCLLHVYIHAQTTADSLPTEVNLKQAVEFSLTHQPVIQQSLVDQQITEANIRSRLADWYPQINLHYNLQHNFVVQTAVIAGNKLKLGTDNTSAAQFTVSQTLFDRDVLLASSTRNTVRRQALQNTSNNKIEIAAAVSKAFYDVLASEQQIKVSTENINRIQRSLKDAYSQYQAGVADKTDYKRATIGLNNATALKKTNEEALKAKLSYLKSLMGYPDSVNLKIQYDSLEMEKEVYFDTTQTVDVTKRIEYKLLETQRSLLAANLRYNKWSFLPSLTANGAYNFNYQNNAFKDLYKENFPNSFAALSLNFPIFQGGKRRADIQAAEWEITRNNLDIINLRNNVNSEFSAAMAGYKSNLANFIALKENLALANEVYDVIQLQYRSGIKTYLEVINSETDLRTAQINYYNSLYNLLASKIDVQKALGQINY